MSLPEPQTIIVLLLLITGGVLSAARRKLTPGGSLTAVIVGILVYAGGRLPALAALFAFFMLATLATAHKKKKKAVIEKHRVHQEQRTVGQVLANGGVPALLGLLAWIFPAYAGTFGIMIAGALSAATADTLSSELGMVYGRSPFNILTLKKEPGGLDGVVSLQGFLFGAAGSLIIGLVYMTGNSSLFIIAVIFFAGTIGNIADSYLGATLERRNMVTNNTVNMINTLVGAIIALLAILVTT